MLMQIDLKGLRALVIGSTAGIGAGIAERLVRGFSRPGSSRRTASK
jgi:NAD(P)-dependent dehydrogenase (short-subunit alcohol dehydrogenase family)